jgi:hypothetical protein
MCPTMERSDLRGVGGHVAPTRSAHAPAPRQARACASCPPARAVPAAKVRPRELPRLRRKLRGRHHHAFRSRQERQSRLPLGAQRAAEPPTGVWGREKTAARAERSGAGVYRCAPAGGGWARQGAAAVCARCRADGGPERRLAARQSAGAVRRRRGLSRCTDRSAGGCVDRHTFVAVRARATVRLLQRSTSG